MSLILVLSDYRIIVFYYHVLSTINMFAGLESTNRRAELHPYPPLGGRAQISSLKNRLEQGKWFSVGPPGSREVRGMGFTSSCNISRDRLCTPSGKALPSSRSAISLPRSSRKHAGLGPLQDKCGPDFGLDQIWQGLALEMRKMLVSHRLQASGCGARSLRERTTKEHNK